MSRTDKVEVRREWNRKAKIATLTIVLNDMEVTQMSVPTVGKTEFDMKCWFDSAFFNAMMQVRENIR